VGVTDRVDRQDLIDEHSLVGGQVRHRHLDQEVGRAGDDVAGHDGWDRGERLLDPNRVLPRVPLDLELDEYGEPEPGSGSVDISPITADDAVLLQRAHPAQAGRGRQRDRLGQIDVGDSSVGLQPGHDGTINSVNDKFWHNCESIATSTMVCCVSEGFSSRICHRVRLDSCHRLAYDHWDVADRTVHPRGAALYIGALLGPGLLLLPGLAASIAGPAAILAWIGLLAISALLATVFSALAIRFPGSGGVVTYIAAGLGRRCGRAGGWCFLLGVIFGAPVVCLVGGDYVTSFTGGGTRASTLFAALILLAVLALALGGARTTTTVQLVLVSVLVIVVAIGVAGAAPSARVANWTPFAPHGYAAVGRAAALVMFSFVGWEAIAPLSNRFTDPARQLPRVIAIAFVVSSVVYLCLAITPTAVLGPAAGSEAPLADLLRVALGAPGRAVAAGAAVVLTLGTTNAYLSGAAALINSLTRPGAHASRSRAPRGFYIAIAGWGLVVLGLHATGAVSTTLLVAVPTALFVTVYLGCTLSALRVLPGRARAAAAPSLAAVVVVLAFSGWAALVAAAVAITAWLAARPSEPERDLAGGVATEDGLVGLGHLGEREAVGDVDLQPAGLDEGDQLLASGAADRDTAVSPGRAAEHLDPLFQTPTEGGDGRDSGTIADELQTGVDRLVRPDQIQRNLHAVGC
jgi:amino acid efflux transporter